MMEIRPNVEIIGCTLWLKKEKVLIINDLHLGYEESLQHKGILVPKFQLETILHELQKVFGVVQPAVLVINGDLKHEFGKILRQEWKEVLQFLDFCQQKCGKIIIVKGNHDPIIESLVRTKEISIVGSHRVGDILIVHGDEIVETDAPVVIIGHEHPAITIRAGSKWEKYKCFLNGKLGKKEIIAVPSFNPLVEGTDILKEKVLSPYLDGIERCKVFIVSQGEVFNFGLLKNIPQR